MPTPAVPSPLDLSRYTYRPPRATHRVGDSPRRRLAKLLCSAFLAVFFSAAFLLFLLFLILRPHRPRFHLSSFSLLPSPPSPSSSSFNVSIRNPNKEIGIYFGTFSASIYYKDDLFATSDRLSSPFYQPPKNTTAVVGTAAVAESEAVAKEIKADLEVAGRVGLRLELRSMVRFRVTVWDTHRRRMHVSCELEVGGDGMLVDEFKGKKCPIYFL